jgi:hypothetical protein
MRATVLATAVTLSLAAPAARAQERPSEDELFGAPPAAAQAQPPAPSGQPPAGDAAGGHGQTESELFGTARPPERAPAAGGGLISREREDWLKVGGLLQLQAQASAYQGSAPRDWPLASPDLLDVYLDARPNDRVRGFVLGRLNYDPTVRSTGSGPAGSGTVGTGTSTVGFAQSSAQNPGGVLDQLWVNFDLDHRAFVTAGRQHVKWGVGKFWNPTDYLHPVKRDPLATFDVRTGTTMLKVHVPWEKRGWNLYGVALLEDAAGDQARTASRLGRVGGGGRAELVLGSAELGLDALAQEGHRPRWGADLSAGVGPLDLYGEAALRTDTDGPRWRRNAPPPALPYGELLGWVRDDRQGVLPQLVAGGSWSVKYSDEDSLTVGAEYFYNGAGYDRPGVYPFLLLGAPAVTSAGVVQQDATAFRPFYLGKHYGAVNLYLPRPGSWNDTTIVATVLGNLSDKSYVARLDSSVLALTYLTVETFVAVHFGQRGGEFRMALPSDLAALASSESGGSTFPTGAPLLDVGIALRVSL